MPSPTVAEINAFIAAKNKDVQLCPCCGSCASIDTSDYSVITLRCHNNDCRLKVERWVMTPGHSLRWCVNKVLKIWNTRANSVCCCMKKAQAPGQEEQTKLAADKRAATIAQTPIAKAKLVDKQIERAKTEGKTTRR